MQQGALITFGIHTRSVPSYFEGIVNIFGARFPLERLVIIAVAVVLVTGLLLLRHTKVGLAMRAVAQDSDAAVIAPVFTVHAYMADGFLIKAFMVIILGGMGSINGAIIAGILVGSIDSFGNFFFGHFAQIILLVLVMAVIVFRPTGLFSGIVFEVFTRDE